MRIVGITATSVVGVIVVGFIVIGIMSIPDVRRYFKMRSM